MLNSLNAGADIRSASTPAGSFYANPQVFEMLAEKVFYRQWLLADVPEIPKNDGDVIPFSMLPGWRNEPMLLTRDQSGVLYCMSNVCTHRGNILVKNAGNMSEIRCRYHGRRFGLDGQFAHMPRMEGAENFPSDEDNLPQPALHRHFAFLFLNLNKNGKPNGAFADMEARLSKMPWQNLVFSAKHSQDYLLKAHWALYVENYLEGFHIPFVHPGLNAVLDPKDYEVVCGEGFVLQIGKARNETAGFDADSLNADNNVAAYYYWLFPNTMLNIYPWGVSVNIINPINHRLSKISYRTYVWDETRLGSGAGGDLEKVEREDQDIVEEVQTGITSHLYNRGRYSPNMEMGVHHFHRLLSNSFV